MIGLRTSNRNSGLSSRERRLVRRRMTLMTLQTEHGARGYAASGRGRRKHLSSIVKAKNCNINHNFSVTQKAYRLVSPAPTSLHSQALPPWVPRNLLSGKPPFNFLGSQKTRCRGTPATPIPGGPEKTHCRRIMKGQDSSCRGRRRDRPLGY